MQAIVSLTKQGQISIPAKMRRKLGIEKGGKVFLRKDRDRLILEPIVDLLDLEGSLENYAFKNKPVKEIMKLEKIAMGSFFAEKHKGNKQ